MTRCQEFLQKGIPVPEQLPRMEQFLTYRRTDGDTDIIFVSNQADSVATATVPFDPGMRRVEVFDPYSRERFAPDATSQAGIEVEIEPFGSRFLIISPDTAALPRRIRRETITTQPVEGRWTISFPDAGTLVTDTLFSWPDSDKHDTRYFSGTATYSVQFVPGADMMDPDSRLILSLGDVKEMAAVRVNGIELPLMWKAPFECDITDAVRPGQNLLEVDITNLWPNRMIGDELEPDDLEWSEPLIYEYAPGKPRAGCYLTSNPDWLRNGTERPSKGRKTVGCFKFFTADSPLLPSGLLGPVTLQKRR